MCVCLFSSYSFWTSSSLDIPAGVAQEEGHTGFLIHLLSAVCALIFLARRILPFLSLVDREVEFCVLTINRSPLISDSRFDLVWVRLSCDHGWIRSGSVNVRNNNNNNNPLGIFSFLVRKIPFAGIELTSQRVRRLHGYLCATGATGYT